MASRMERYYKNELVNSGRSSRNKSLYQQIQDLDNYTNIEGVASIDKTNEIDISKVQELLKNRENYKKQKKLKSLLHEEQKEIEDIPKQLEQQKNYDINEALSKIKKDSTVESRYRSLDDKQYETLKRLSKKNKEFDIEKEEEELKELIQTITSNKELNDLASADDVGLLDELKSNTVVGDAASIKKILEEEKEIKKIENTMEIDNSFYTSSFGFTSKDFEDLKNINHNIKKSNKFIIILLIVIIVLFITLGILFLILK